MRGDGGRRFRAEVFRSLDGGRVADFVDDLRQSQTREAQDFLEFSNSGSGFAIVAGRLWIRAPGQCSKAAEDAGRLCPRLLSESGQNWLITGHPRRLPWLRDARAPAPRALIATMHGVPILRDSPRDCSQGAVMVRGRSAPSNARQIRQPLDPLQNRGTSEIDRAACRRFVMPGADQTRQG